jgi:uncharacterized membrane protein
MRKRKKIKDITAKYINIPIYLSLIVILNGIIMMILDEYSGGILQSRFNSGVSSISANGESLIFSGVFILTILLIMKLFSK